MMGPKKLSAIREELKRALAETTDDPIRWLEERMAAANRSDAAGRGEKEVLQSLRWFLEGPVKGKKRKQSPRTKK